MSKPSVSMCDPYIWEDPRYLFRSTWLDRYMNKQRGVCFSELINEIAFVYVFSIVCGALAYGYTKVSSAPLIAILAATVYLIPVFLKLQDVDAFRTQFVGSEFVGQDDEDLNDAKPKKEEGFAGCMAPITRDRGGAISGLPSNTEPFAPASDTMKDVEGNPLTTKFQSQTGACVKNPFANVLIDEIKYAPTRDAAPDITTSARKIELDDFFRVQWYSDPTDVFGKSQSQRQFITQPSTTIPNDQASYQDWLYKIPGKTCKEGGAPNCYGGTNGGALPWANL